MNAKLAVGIAMFLGGIATQLIGLEHGWQDATSPSFIAGILLNISGAVTAIWGGVDYQPDRKNQRTRSTDLTRTDEPK